MPHGRRAWSKTGPRRGASVCPRTEPPIATFPAHTTPLGLTYYGASQFPEAFRGRIFVALHGSSKRQVQAGYELVSVEVGTTGAEARVESFASGWLLDPSRSPREPDQNWGRPVQPVVGPDGALYLSDDAWGAVYRIWWAG